MCIENRYCAFIDILGFKNKMKNFEDALKYDQSYFQTSFKYIHKTLAKR